MSTANLLTSNPMLLKAFVAFLEVALPLVKAPKKFLSPVAACSGVLLKDTKVADNPNNAEFDTPAPFAIPPTLPDISVNSAAREAL